jgi:hypothetical protein
LKPCSGILACERFEQQGNAGDAAEELHFDVVCAATATKMTTTTMNSRTLATMFRGNHTSRIDTKNGHGNGNYSGRPEELGNAFVLPANMIHQQYHLLAPSQPRGKRQCCCAVRRILIVVPFSMRRFQFPAMRNDIVTAAGTPTSRRRRRQA